MLPEEHLRWTRCCGFLASFAPRELAAMKEMFAFFHALSAWAANAGPMTWFPNNGALPASVVLARR